MATHGQTSDQSPVDRLAEEFLGRHRRGERPSVAEYVERHPEWADQIREVFPALVMMERLKPTPDELAGGRGGAAPASRRLGDYRIIREVGRGGMGVVYEAVQESLGRHVALKVLPWHGRIGTSQLDRFRLEARSAARMHHTNIVPVYDIGEHDGVYHYSMQFIQGQGLDVILRDLRRLRDRVPAVGDAPAPGEALTISVARAHGLLDGPPTAAAGPLDETSLLPGTAPGGGMAVGSPPTPPPPMPGRSELVGLSEARYYRSVGRIGAQVADALAYAHAQGVLHRDIKPSNLLLDAAGQVWVADFGLAKVEGSDGPTGAGDVVGTLRYMAPERFQGLSDPRSDVYGLGATLYELLTLRPAFGEPDRVKLIEEVLHATPTPPRQLDPAIPRDLETIVLKAMARDPKDRFATAGAVRDELRRFVEGHPIRSRPVPFYERFARWCRRNPGLAGASVAAAAVTAVLAVGSMVAAWTFSRQRDQISVNLARIRQAEADGRERLFEALTERAKAGRFSRRVGQRFDGLEALAQASRIGRELHLPADRLETVRDDVIACLALPDMRPDGRAIRRPPGVECLAFAPAMDRYALRFTDGEVVVRRTADDGVLARFRARGDRNIYILRFSPDGRYLATTHYPDSALTVWDVDRGTVALEDPGPVFGRAANFSPDGRQVVLAHLDGETSVRDLADGRLVRRWAGPDHTNDLAFRPDGRQVAAATRRHANARDLWQVVDVDTGKVLRSAALPINAEVAWSPDGRTLATPCGDRRIYLWDPETGARKGLLEGHTNAGLGAAYHPSGLLLVSNGWENRMRLWDPLLGRPVLMLPSTLQEVNVGRDGQVVAQIEDDLIPYRIDPALEYRTLIPTSAAFRSYGEATVRGDGRILAVCVAQGVLLLDLARGRELGFLPGMGACRVLFEPSGDLLVAGSMGVWRWPIRRDPEGEALRIGPPARLPLPPSFHDLAEDGAGRIVALADIDTVHLLIDGHGSRIGPVDKVRYVAVSPDGQWLATGEHLGGAQVRRIRDGFKVADLPHVGLTTVAFSPDGRWLIANGGPCRLWEVGTWREVRRIGGRGFAFSPDGRILAVQDPSKVIRLVEVESGRTLARLESPDLCEVQDAVFGTDGARLVVTTPDGPAVHVWDLRAIRRHLAGMGLDWDAPAYPDRDPAEPSSPPLTTGRIDLSSFADADDVVRLATRAGRSAERRQFDAAIADYEEALRRGGALDAPIRPLLAVCCNNREWELVTANPKDRNPARAVALARRGVELGGGRDPYLNTLGVALYRAGLLDEAVATLEKSLAVGPGPAAAYDLFVLAMAHHRLGRPGGARVELDRAIAWNRNHRQERPESHAQLQAFQAEAEAILAGPSGDLPADPFAPDPGR